MWLSWCSIWLAGTRPWVPPPAPPETEYTGVCLNLSAQGVRAEVQVILGYRVSSSPVWATETPSQENQNALENPAGNQCSGLSWKSCG